MGLYKRFETNQKLENEGVWMDYGDGFEVCLARASRSNKKFLKAAEKYQRKYQRKIQQKSLPESEAYEAAIRIYAETVVLDWKGAGNDPNGKPLECNPQTVAQAFRDLPDFFDHVREDAGDFELYREHVEVEEAKN